jgi:hypothetical protein
MTAEIDWNRYIVIKRKEAKEVLDTADLLLFNYLLDKIAQKVEPKRYLVVSETWSIFPKIKSLMLYWLNGKELSEESQLEKLDINARLIKVEAWILDQTKENSSHE